jgi:serine O-acetyltransferase
VNNILNHQDLPDPVADRCKDMEMQIEQLKHELEEMKKGEHRYGNTAL